VTTTGSVNPYLFTNVVAQIGGLGTNGNYSATLGVPEPTTLALLSIAGFGAILFRVRRRS
jgi:hypothetical protein